MNIEFHLSIDYFVVPLDDESFCIHVSESKSRPNVLESPDEVFGDVTRHLSERSAFWLVQKDERCWFTS